MYHENLDSKDGNLVQSSFEEHVEIRNRIASNTCRLQFLQYTRTEEGGGDMHLPISSNGLPVGYGGIWD